MGMGGAKKAARIQAEATRKSAELNRKTMMEQAAAMQAQQERSIERQKALDAAKRMEENQVKQKVEVDTGVDDNVPDDDNIKRRRPMRERFNRDDKTSGLQI